MKNKLITLICLIALVIALTVSCASNKSTSTVSAQLTATGTIKGWVSDEEAIATVTPTAGQMPETYNASDYEFNVEAFEKIEISLSNLEASYANGDITIEEKKKVTKITLGNASKYNLVLTGESNVGITITSETNDFVLTLQDVTITSKDASDEQALKTKGSTTCFVILEGTNTLTGCTDSTGETQTNAIKAGGSLVITGDGTLNVIANTKNGIVSDDVIVIQSGNVNVTLNSETSAGTGIKPVNGYVQNGGAVTVTGLNLTEGCENKGIKVDGDEEETEYGKGKGYILINGGEITINTSGKGISAGFDTTEDGNTSSSTNDPLADIFINNGLINITTYATPREDTYASDGTSNDDGVSPEGLEGKHSVVINGGKIIINTTDDCINSSITGEATIIINGGLIYAHSTQNDCIDSNGTLVINGGTIIALGSNVPEGGLDCDTDSRFTYTGGTIIAMGGTNQIPNSDSTTGHVIYSGSSMNMGGFGGQNFEPQDFGGNGRQKPEDLSDMPDMSNMPNNKPQDLPEPPTGAVNNAGNPPEMPNGFAGSFDPFQQENTSERTTYAVLDSNGNVVVAFTVPSGCVTTSVLIASDAFTSGSVVTYTSNATLTKAEYTFADCLAFGDVSVELTEYSVKTLYAYSTSVKF